MTILIATLSDGRQFSVHSPTSRGSVAVDLQAMLNDGKLTAHAFDIVAVQRVNSECCELLSVPVRVTKTKGSREEVTVVAGKKTTGTSLREDASASSAVFGAIGTVNERSGTRFVMFKPRRCKHGSFTGILAELLANEEFAVDSIVAAAVTDADGEIQWSDDVTVTTETRTVSGTFVVEEV